MTEQTTPTARVLLVAGEIQLRRALERGLAGAGFSVSAPGDADAAEILAESFAPDIVIVDVEMEQHGSRPLHLRLREATENYLLCIEQGGRGRTRIELLRAGADDAVSMPVTPEEIVARCHAMLRRPRSVQTKWEAVTPTVLSVGPITIDTGRHEIRFDDEEVHTTKIEFQLLAELCRRPAEVASRTDLLEAVWGPHWVGDTHVVDVHLSNLRRKLHDASEGMPIIRTVRGVGFRLSNEMLDAAERPVELAVAS